MCIRARREGEGRAGKGKAIYTSCQRKGENQLGVAKSSHKRRSIEWIRNDYLVKDHEHRSRCSTFLHSVSLAFHPHHDRPINDTSYGAEYAAIIPIHPGAGSIILGVPSVGGTSADKLKGKNRHQPAEPSPTPLSHPRREGHGLPPEQMRP